MMVINQPSDLDTLAPLKDSQELPKEILAAIEKHDDRQAKKWDGEGWGATTGGLELTKRSMGALGAAVFVGRPRRTTPTNALC